MRYNQQIKDNRTEEIFTIGKYWETDTDPNSYKVKLFNENRHYNFYSSDLKLLIKEGQFSLID